MEHKARPGAALVIGVGRYASNQIPDLPFATADAEAIAGLLVDPGVCAFPTGAVRVLKDDEARRDAIVHHIAQWLPQQAAGADIAVLYFAGHGVMHRLGPREEAFLVPHDASPDDVVTWGVAMSDVGRWLEAADARSVVLLVDCCHAGSIVTRRDVTVAPPRLELGLRASLLQGIAGKGRFILASCDDGQYSLEAPELGHGLFTHHLLDGIRGAGDRDGDGFVGVTELFEHVAAAVERDSTVRFRQLQKPWFSAVGTGGVYLAPSRPMRAQPLPHRGDSVELELPATPEDATAPRPDADLPEGDLISRLHTIERDQNAREIPTVMRYLGSASPAVSTAAQRALHAIGWGRAAAAIEELTRAPDPGPMGAVLRGLGAIEATVDLVALLDRLADRLKGDLRSAAVLLVERKRLGLSLETTQALFREIRSPYRFRRALGQGLLTAAYLVQDEEGEMEHVIRLLRPEFAQQPRLRGQFLEVSHRAMRLVHQNLVLTREVRAFPDRAVYYALRDYVEGVTLRELLLAGHPFSPLQIVHLLRQVLEALAPVHALGLCHGGIKPSNIFVCPGDRILVGDLSLPLHLGIHALERLSYDFRYAPPEMMSGAGGLGPAADLYALGCVAYELLCGAPPFVSDSYLELAVMHARESVAPPRERNPAVPPAAEVFVLSLLARSPTARFSSLKEALQELDTVARALPSSAHATAPVELPSDRSLLDAADRTVLSLGSPPPPSPAVRSDAASPAIPGKIGKYLILERIGRGGMGTVFKARDPVLDRTVALKVISPDIEINEELRARFFREAQAIAKLSHPNLVTVYDMGEEDGRLFIVMEYLEGEELRRLIAQRRSVALEDALSIMRQVCEGLHFAHQRGVVHRDIKPGNILVQPNGQIKILDFGLAQIATLGAGITRAGLIMGTLRYISPEQARGRADHRSDIFSVGAVLYEVLAFRPPFRAEDPMELLEQLQTGNPIPLTEVDPSIPPGLAAIVDRAMRKNPDERFADLGQMGSEIEQVQRDLGEHRQATARLLSDARAALHEGGYERCLELLDQVANIPPPADAVADIASLREALRAGLMAQEQARGREQPEDRLLVEAPMSLPEQAERTMPARRLYENAQFTVFRPRIVRPGLWHPLLAFAHLAERPADAPPNEPSPVEEVQRQARQILGAAVSQYQEIIQDSGQAVPADGEIAFVPEIAGVEFNPPRRSFRWRESVHREEFRLRAGPELDGTNARGRLAVFLGSILLAEVTLVIRVEAGHPAAAEIDGMATDQGGRYRRIFASYSHRDRSIVEEVARYAAMLGDEFARDLVHLRSGEVWSDRLERLIEEADVFQLFWSSTSMRSPFVRQEWEHALSLGRPGFVRPTYWEEPLPAAPAEGLPPAPLARLHFYRLYSPATPAAAPIVPPARPGGAADPEPLDPDRTAFERGLGSAGHSPIADHSPTILVPEPSVAASALPPPVRSDSRAAFEEAGAPYEEAQRIAREAMRAEQGQRREAEQARPGGDDAFTILVGRIPPDAAAAPIPRAPTEDAVLGKPVSLVRWWWLLLLLGLGLALTLLGLFAWQTRS